MERKTEKKGKMMKMMTKTERTMKMRKMATVRTMRMMKKKRRKKKVERRQPNNLLAKRNPPVRLRVSKVVQPSDRRLMRVSLETRDFNLIIND